MHNYAWLCIIMHSYVWLCIIINDYHDLDPFVPFYVFVTNGVKLKDGELSGTSLWAEFPCASFSFSLSLRKKLFSGVWTFHVFLTFFWKKMVWPKNATEVSGTTLGPFPTYSGPFSTHFDQNRIKNYIRQIHIQIPPHRRCGDSDWV